MKITDLRKEFVRSLCDRFLCGNADVMPLWNPTTREWVCYFVPRDRSEPGMYMTHNGAEQLVVEINVPYSTVMMGYESYLRMGFGPVLPDEPKWSMLGGIFDSPCESCGNAMWEEQVQGRLLCEECARRAKRPHVIWWILILAAVGWAGFIAFLIYWFLIRNFTA